MGEIADMYIDMAFDEMFEYDDGWGDYDDETHEIRLQKAFDELLELDKDE